MIEYVEFEIFVCNFDTILICCIMYTFYIVGTNSRSDCLTSVIKNLVMMIDLIMQQLPTLMNRYYTLKHLFCLMSRLGLLCFEDGERRPLGWTKEDDQWNFQTSTN